MLSVFIIPVSALAESNWAMKYVDFCINQGLFLGKTRTGVLATDTVKRKEVAYALFKTETPEQSWHNSDPCVFPDVPSGTNYTGAINWTAYVGVMNGTSTGDFDPDVAIRKQDLAVTIYRYLLNFSVNKQSFLGYNGGAINTTARNAALANAFTDHASISNYAKNAVYELLNAGVITGSEGGTFEPLSNIPITEAACMIVKAHGYRYNTPDSINVYLRTYAGASFNNVAVAFLRKGSTTSGVDKDMQVRTATNGIANLTSSEKVAGAHYYVNAMSQYTSTFSTSTYEPTPFYKYLTIPRNLYEYPLTSSYNRAALYQHSSSCEEAAWSFPQWCPTDLMHSGQNFGWRYAWDKQGSPAVVFHQGMDYHFADPNDDRVITNTTNFTFDIIASASDPYMGNYVRCYFENGSDWYFVDYLHLDSRSVKQDDYVLPGGKIGVGGSTGTNAAHLHVNLIKSSGYDPDEDSPTELQEFFDPRIYFK